MREKHVTIYIKCISADFRQTAANVMPTSVKQPPEVPKDWDSRKKWIITKRKKGPHVFSSMCCLFSPTETHCCCFCMHNKFILKNLFFKVVYYQTIFQNEMGIVTSHDIIHAVNDIFKWRTAQEWCAALAVFPVCCVNSLKPHLKQLQQSHCSPCTAHSWIVRQLRDDWQTKTRQTALSASILSHFFPSPEHLPLLSLLLSCLCSCYTRAFSKNILISASLFCPPQSTQLPPAIHTHTCLSSYFFRGEEKVNSNTSSSVS